MGQVAGTCPLYVKNQPIKNQTAVYVNTAGDLAKWRCKFGNANLHMLICICKLAMGDQKELTSRHKLRKKTISVQPNARSPVLNKAILKPTSVNLRYLTKHKSWPNGVTCYRLTLFGQGLRVCECV